MDGAPPTTQSPAQAPHLIWWALLEQRVSEVKLMLPAHLRGRIRFNVARADFGTSVLTIDVDGPKTELRSSDRPGDADVETSDALLERLLLDDTPPQDVFRVSGNRQLFEAFFRSLSNTTPTSSWLDLQVRK